jgi:nucleoside-diphosphate-sugar epimerase
MNIFVAGATGTLGIPLVRELIAQGHHVVGMTRSPEKRPLLEALGATAAVVDARDDEALTRAVRAAAPTHVLHLLTALPKGGPMRAADLTATNELRVTGTANLLRAAIAAGAQRLVAESFVGIYGYGDLGSQPRGEDDLPPLQGPDAGIRAISGALRSLEQQVLNANASGKIEAMVLRYGMFYGLGNPSTRSLLDMLRRRRLPLPRNTHGLASFIQLDDAVRATIAALERGRAGAIYNIVDDEPIGFADFLIAAALATGAPRPIMLPRWLLSLAAPMGVTTIATRLPVSNARARSELGWRPQFPSYREGVAQLARELTSGSDNALAGMRS